MKLKDLEKRLEELKAATDGTVRQCEIVEKDVPMIIYADRASQERLGPCPRTHSIGGEGDLKEEAADRVHE